MNDIVQSIAGMQIFTTTTLVKPGPEDWSEVRSHGRARRRLKQEHPQRIRKTIVPRTDFIVRGSTVFCHPAMYHALRREMKAKKGGV